MFSKRNFINSVTVIKSELKIGEVINDTTCEYDGMIGNVQRNEADTFIQFVRPDSTPCEPGVLLTFSELDDSPRIYSVRQTSNKYDVRDILYLWTNFDDDVWFYFLYGLVISSVVFAFIPIVMLLQIC